MVVFNEANLNKMIPFSKLELSAVTPTVTEQPFRALIMGPVLPEITLEASGAATERLKASLQEIRSKVKELKSELEDKQTDFRSLEDPTPQEKGAITRAKNDLNEAISEENQIAERLRMARENFLDSARPSRILNPDQAKSSYGEGSILHLMSLAWFSENIDTETYILPVAAPSGTVVRASTTITLTLKDDETITASSGGLLRLRFWNRNITISLNQNLSIDEAGGAIVTALNELKDFPIISSYEAGVVTLTAKDNTVHSNTLKVSFENISETNIDFMLADNGEFSGGNGSINLQQTLEALRERDQFNIIVSPFNNDENIKLQGRHLDFMANVEVSKEGLLLLCLQDEASVLLNRDDNSTINYRYISVVSSPKYITPDYVIAANVAAQVAREGAIDPARPFTSLKLNQINSSPETLDYETSEREALLKGGFSTFFLNSNRESVIERLVTSYTENDVGTPDNTFVDINTPLTISRLRFSFSTYFYNKYIANRYKIANDNPNIPTGQPILQPKTAKADAINLFETWQEDGLVEDAELFQDTLVVEKQGNLMIFGFRTKLIDQLRGLAAVLYYTKED